MVTSHWDPPGCLTGHKVRFSGVEGKAGTYNPDGDKYTFIPSEGWTRQVEVSAKYIEDLGVNEDDPFAKWDSSKVIYDAKCTVCGRDTKGSRMVTTPVICWNCKLKKSNELKEAKARR